MSETQKGGSGAGTHIVKQGDCIESIAERYGHYWKKLWEHAKNTELRKKREDPNILLPGDEVFIPPIDTIDRQCATDRVHKFVRKGVPSHLRVRFIEEDGVVLSDKPYTIVIDGRTRRGKTDGDGWIDESIPPQIKMVHLTFDELGLEFELAVGGVDPLDEISGAKCRLRNLGYDIDVADDKLSEDFVDVVKDFQRVHDLEMTGELDDRTLAQLKDLHGR